MWFREKNKKISAHSLVCHTDQLSTTKWLRQELDLPTDAPVYFDDADLVWIDKTVMDSVLVDPTARLGQLRRALQKHISDLVR